MTMLLVDETCISNVAPGEVEPRELPWQYYIIVADKKVRYTPGGRRCVAVSRHRVETLEAQSKRALRRKLREFIDRRGVKVVKKLPEAGSRYSHPRPSAT
jgi:hypothetical protein